MTTVAQTRTIHTVRGGGGLRLHVREAGRRPPILFIHGLAQSHLAGQAATERAGRGVSGWWSTTPRPRDVAGALEPEHYTNGQLWADDLAAIIEQLRLDRPVLVGWSYGGFVICDYLRAHGQDRIGAIDCRRGHQAGPGSLRHPDRPGFPLRFRRRHRGRPADQHPGHRPGQGLPGHAGSHPRRSRRCCARA